MSKTNFSVAPLPRAAIEALGAIQARNRDIHLEVDSPDNFTDMCEVAVEKVKPVAFGSSILELVVALGDNLFEHSGQVRGPSRIETLTPDVYSELGQGGLHLVMGLSGVEGNSMFEVGNSEEDSEPHLVNQGSALVVAPEANDIVVVRPRVPSICVSY